MSTKVLKTVSLSIDSTKYPDISPIDLLRWEFLPSAEFEMKPSQKRISDIQLILDRDRLIGVLGEDAYNAMIRSMSNPVASPYKSGKFSDELLASTVKSRYLQAPSEVKAWADSLVDRGIELNKAIQDCIEDEKQSLLRAELEKQQSKTSSDGAEN